MITDTDIDPDRRNTGEQEPQNGRIIWGYVKKWGLLIGLIVGGGAAWQTVRSCTVAGADAMGLQTKEAAEKTQLKNIESHNLMWKAIERVEKQTQEAADYSRKSYEALPEKWKRRVNP